MGLEQSENLLMSKEKTEKPLESLEISLKSTLKVTKMLFWKMTIMK